MTVRTGKRFVTPENFEGRWDALWNGWYTNQQRGEFRIKIERLGKGPHVTVELSDRNIVALQDKFGPAFNPEEGAAVVLGGVIEIDGQENLDMVATRESRDAPIFLQAIGETVRLAISDADWAACRERLGIGRALESESEEVE